MWDEALECPHLNPLPEGEDVFSVALISHISHFINTWLKRGAWPGLLPLKRFGAPSGIMNTQLKQGVTSEKSTLNRTSSVERPTPNAHRRTQRLRLAIKR